MNATPSLKVEVDPALRADPAIFSVVQKATGFLDNLIGEHPELPAENRELIWTLQRIPQGEDRLEVNFSEQDGYGNRRAVVWFSGRDMLDEVARDIRMMRLYQGILDQRWRQVDTRLEQHIRQLEEEERNGEPDAH